MYRLNTTDTAEWLDALQSKHQLPLDILSYQKQHFFSDVKVDVSSKNQGVAFANVMASSYHGRYHAKVMKGDNEAFLFTHSFDAFRGIQNGKSILNSNFSFCIDLTKNFDGYFHDVGHTKSIILPYHLLTPRLVDFFKKASFQNSHLYTLVNQLLRNIDINDSVNFERKVSQLVNLLSVYDLDVNHLGLDAIPKFYLDKMHERNCQNIESDMFSSVSLNISTAERTQYILSEKNTSSGGYLAALRTLRSAVAA